MSRCARQQIPPLKKNLAYKFRASIFIRKKMSTEFPSGTDTIYVSSTKDDKIFIVTKHEFNNEEINNLFEKLEKFSLTLKYY